MLRMFVRSRRVNDCARVFFVRASHRVATSDPSLSPWEARNPHHHDGVVVLQRKFGVADDADAGCPRLRGTAEPQEPFGFFPRANLPSRANKSAIGGSADDNIFPRAVGVL